MSELKNILINRTSCKSIWFMRQAGRYLPEFRKIRSQNQNFIKLCLDSELSSEITLQPIKRFDLDSAIIFSDILMVPHALGQHVEFTKEFGPRLSQFDNNTFYKKNENEFSNKLKPVYKAIEMTRKKLNKEKSLICFIGAPWTLILYMFGLRKNKSEKEPIDLSELDNKKFLIDEIMDKLVNFLCIHIKNQINAGADVVQIFDSWAGLLPSDKVIDYCFEPNAKIVEFCKKYTAPCICFPKGIGQKYELFNKFVKSDGINLDSNIDPSWARDKLKNVVIQGGLDPKELLKSENQMFEGATKYIKAFREMPYVFNLGHGLLPETDPDKVDKLIKFYRNF